MDDQNSAAVERAVRNLLSSSRGKRPEDILSNSDALADYVADAFLLVKSLEQNNNARFLQICQMLAVKSSKYEVSSIVKRHTSARMVEA